MDKKKVLEEGHEKAAPIVVDATQSQPAKKDGPHMAEDTAPDTHAPVVVMPVAALEGRAEQARQATAMQRGVGNTRVGRILTAQDHADGGAAKESSVKEKEALADKHVSPIELEQEKGKGHV